MFNASRINLMSPHIIITAVILCLGIIVFIYKVMKNINNEKFFLGIINN